MVKSESAKIAAGGACTGIIAELNEGNKLAVGGTAAAFLDGSSSTAGQVGIAGLTGGCPVAGTLVTIDAGAVATGTAAADYPGGALMADVTYTPE
ncbi:MAG: hypothetical protein KZQ77_03165, partial [Candidatus Thiodiazotropha sp. (ex Notomyrtea botanica)]|nr:hypothetical protein [Candidatus Thiodiazotropha sp. (ex Notomyrtea botanica)]